MFRLVLGQSQGLSDTEGKNGESARGLICGAN